MSKRLAAPVLALLLLGLFQLGGLRPGLSNDGLDLLFRLRGPQPPDQRIVLIGIDEPSLRRLGAWPFARRLHAQLLDRLRQAKAVGFDLLFPEPSADDSLFNQALAQGPPVVLAVAHERDGRLARPAPPLDGSRGLGHIETQLAGDGIVRRVNLDSLGDVAPFSLALLQAAAITSPLPVPVGPQIINFHGPEESFLFLSYHEVLSGRYPPAFFRDRLVLVGARAVGLGDSHITAFTRELPTPGVEIQATIVSNLLQQAFIRPLPLVAWLLIGLIGLLAVLVWPDCGERVNLVVNLALAAAIFLLALFLFRQACFVDYPLVLLFLFLAYPIHLLLQLLRAASRILLQARRLDRELDAGLRLVAGTIPAPYLRTAHRANPLTASAIQRHLDRLQTAVHALGLQHHFLEQLLKEELPPLILWEQASGHALFANSAFVRLWQDCTGAGQPLPSHPRFLETIAGSQATENDPPPFRDPGTFEVLGPGGRRFYQVELHPLLAPETGFHGLLAVLQDITGIKELERVKDEVVAIVSHELRLPLTTILGYGELLSDALSGDHQLYAREICGQSRRLQRMIEDFLDIARLESGRTQVRRFPFPPGRMLEDAIAAVGDRARRKAIAIVLNQPRRTTPLVGDESLLLQALINLLDNAIKFSPAQTTVTVDLEEQPACFLFRIADQGPGIAVEDRARIFDKFQRGRQAATAEGFGLGLHLVRQIVERHQGRIEVLEAVAGAIFQIVLPKRETAAHPEEAESCA